MGEVRLDVAEGSIKRTTLKDGLLAGIQPSECIPEGGFFFLGKLLRPARDGHAASRGSLTHETRDPEDPP